MSVQSTWINTIEGPEEIGEACVISYAGFQQADVPDHLEFKTCVQGHETKVCVVTEELVDALVEWGFVKRV